MSPSPDGKTYLAIDEGYGPACSVTVDGHPWPKGLHVLGAVAAGTHTVACGLAPGAPEATLSIVIQDGTTFHFDYWGP
jgi:hypothetical protein